jgi:hypothetical protein
MPGVWRRRVDDTECGRLFLWCILEMDSHKRKRLTFEGLAEKCMLILLFLRPRPESDQLPLILLRLPLLHTILIQ